MKFTIAIAALLALTSFENVSAIRIRDEPVGDPSAEDKEKALEKQSKELLRYIPIAGKDIYWRLGPGEDKIKKQRLDKLRGKD